MDNFVVRKNSKTIAVLSFQFMKERFARLFFYYCKFFRSRKSLQFENPYKYRKTNKSTLTLKTNYL